MNILFLVFSFLLIFLFFSSTLLKQTIYFSSEQKSCCSYVEGKRKLHDKFERYKYKSYQEKKDKSKAPVKKRVLKAKNEADYVSHRLRSNLSSLSKWNLAPYLLSKKPTAHLESSLLVFLESLYGHTEFWEKAKKESPDFSKKLLDSFREKDFAESLPELFPEDPLLQKVFYKMLKGSGYYNITLKQGHPPLESFFRLEKDDTHTLSLSYASYLSLKALLGKELLEKVLQIEKEKWESKGGYYSITKKEFIDLTSYLGLNVPIQEWESLFLAGHKKAKLERLTQKEGKRAYLEVFLP